MNARATNNTTTGSNRSNFTYSNSEWIHEDLATNAEYKLKIADVAQRHLFNNGTLTPTKAQVLFDARAAQISAAIIADCARWGTNATNHTYAQWQARLANIRTNFFPTRTATVIAALQARGFYPAVNPPVFSQHGGQVATNYPLTLGLGGQTGTIYYTLDGTDPRAVGGAFVGTLYGGAIPITQNNTLVRTRFLSSGAIWSALDEALFTFYTPAVAGKLVVSKLHYNPTGPTATESAAGYGSSDFEYIELLNISPETLDLHGVALSGAVTFSFASSAIQVLAPGARVVIAGNAAAFTARYGAGQPVAGAYGGNLNNGGETLRIADVNNATIVQVAYLPTAPWPTAADGLGPALVLVNPSVNPDPNLGTNWRASYVPGGVPGTADAWTVALWRAKYFSAADLADPAKEATLWGNDADPDNDGAKNFAEFVLATSPLDPAAHPALTTTLFTDPGTTQRYLRLQCRVREGLAAGISSAAQGSSDLAAWSAGPTLLYSLPQGDGTLLTEWQDNVSLESSPTGRRFLRLQLTGN